MRALALPLAASLGAQALAAFTALTPAVFAVVAAPDLGISAREVGGFTVLLFLAASLSAPALGGFAVGFGAIRLSQICLCLCAAGIALTATASLPLAILGGVLVGLGYGPMTPASSHLLAAVTNDRTRPLVFSIKQTSVPLGGLFAGLLVPAMVGVGGWRGAALMVAGCCLAMAAALEPSRKRLDGAGAHWHMPRLRANLAEALKEVSSNVALRALGLTSLVYSAMQLCLGTYLVTFLVEDAGYALATAGFVLSVAQGAGMAGRIGWGALGERVIASRVLLALLGVGTAAAALVLAQANQDWSLSMAIVVAIAFGATGVGWNGLYLSEIVRVSPPGQSARATGAVLFFTFSGMMLGPAAFAAIAAVSDYRTAFMTMALVVLMPAIALMMAHWRARNA